MSSTKVWRGAPPAFTKQQGSRGPECPGCGERRSGVLDGRPNPEGIRRRRLCSSCGMRFTTQETVVSFDRLRDPEALVGDNSEVIHGS